jgi:uncharacterized protein (TIGR03000 family)
VVGSAYVPATTVVAQQATPVNRQARVIIEVPADAKLYVDNYLTKAEGMTQRHFTTPALETGQEYFYNVKAEVIRDGKTISETKRITVRAGAEVRASFGEMQPAVASK